MPSSSLVEVGVEVEATFTTFPGGWVVGWVGGVVWRS